MPDSFSLPPWGSQPYDERDLDSLLAGNTDVPVALRGVADTLSALRGAPMAGELRDESAARAQFRAMIPDAHRASGQAAHTLVMPAVPGPRRPRGSRRRAAGRARVRSAGLVAAAAVFVLGAAIAYTGNLPGPVQRLAHDTIAAPSAKSPSAGASGGLQGKSAQPDSPRATPATGNAPSSPSSSLGNVRQTLCDAFWTDLEHAQPGQMSWQTSSYKQLVAAAGGPKKVFAYCFPVWDPRYAHQYPTLPSYPPYFPKHWNNGKQPADQGQGQRPGSGNGADSGNGAGPGAQPPAAPGATKGDTQQGNSQ